MTTQMLEQKQNRTTGEMLTQVPGSIRTKGLAPAKLAGILPFKWAMFNRLTSTLIPRYHRASAVERVVHTLAMPLLWSWWRIVELLLIVQCGLWSRFGTRPSLVPTTPVEVDTFGVATPTNF